MRLFELTGPEREGIERQVAQIMDYFLKNVRPSIQALQKYYAQQYPKAYWQAYTKSMEQLTKLYSYLAHDVNAYTEAMQKTDPNYKFPVVVMDTIKKQLITHIRHSNFKPKDIHMAKHATQLQYQDNPGVPNHQQIEGEVKRLVSDLKNSLKKPIKPRGGRKPPTPPVVDPNPPVDPVTPADPKKPGTDLSTDVKLKQLGYDDGVKGEYIPGGARPDRSKLDKFGQIIDGEWSVVNNAMKRLPDLTPKQLMDMRPKVGDYVEWTGGPRSSRPGEMNIGKILQVKPKGILRVQSMNQQPNRSREGFAKFLLDPQRVKREDGEVKYLDAGTLSKRMPQQDPKKYRKPGAGTTVHQGTGIGDAIKKGMAGAKQLRNFK